MATVCGPGIMAAAPFPDLRLFSWGNNSAQMAKPQVDGPQGGRSMWPCYSHGHRFSSDIRSRELKASLGSVSSHSSRTHSPVHTLTRHSLSGRVGVPGTRDTVVNKTWYGSLETLTQEWRHSGSCPGPATF